MPRRKPELKQTTETEMATVQKCLEYAMGDGPLKFRRKYFKREVDMHMKL